MTLGKTFQSLPSSFVRWIAEWWLVGVFGMALAAVDALPHRKPIRVVFEFIVAAIGWLGILIMVGGLAVISYQALHDRYLIARSGARRKIGLSEFLEVLLSLYRPGPYARFLRTVRRAGKIEPCDEAHRAVAALLLVAQSGSPERAAGVPELSDEKKLKAFASRVHRSPDAISELARLVEQLQNTGRVG